MRLLEQTKTLFDSEGIIVVLSADLVQLSCAIQGYYGTGYASAVYLERFYDDKFTLTPVNAVDYLKKLGFVNAASYWFDSVVFDLAQKRDMTMRDCMRMQKLKSARDYFIAFKHQNDSAIAAMNSAILPVLVFIDREDPRLWTSIRSGVDVEAVYRVGKDCPHFVQMVDACIANSIRNGVKQDIVIDEETRRRYVSDLCAILFIDDYDDERRASAYNNELIRLWGNPSVRVFRTLGFGR